jgi:neutral ceramidase
MAVESARTAVVEAGIAQADITPGPNSHLAGYVARTTPATGVHDPLRLYAIAVSAPGQPQATSVLLVADLIGLDIPVAAEISEAIAARLRLPAAQIAVAVTHTHGGPTVTGTRLGGPADPAYLPRVIAAAADCCDRAFSERRPATVHVGRAELASVAYNRRAGESVIDPAVHAVVLRGLAGELLGVLFSYACHPVVLGPDNTLVTADWPAYARAQLAQSLRVPVVFAQGCGGQINDGHPAEESLRVVKSDRRTFAEAERVGTLVAAAAARAVRSAGSSDRLRAAPPDAAESSDAAALPVAVTSVMVSLPFADGPADPLTAPVAVHRWGDARLLCLPGEPFVELGMHARAAAGDQDLVVLGYTGGVPGYLPYPPALYENGGYEVCEAHHFYGQPSCFAPEAGLRIRAAADRLLAGDGAGRRVPQ